MNGLPGSQIRRRNLRPGAKRSGSGSSQSGTTRALGKATFTSPRKAEAGGSRRALIQDAPQVPVCSFVRSISAHDWWCAAGEVTAPTSRASRHSGFRSKQARANIVATERHKLVRVHLIDGKGDISDQCTNILGDLVDDCGVNDKKV